VKTNFLLNILQALWLNSLRYVENNFHSWRGLIFLQIPPKKTEEELKEEEELQLALALSKSEAEEKEKEVGRIPAFSFTFI